MTGIAAAPRVQQQNRGWRALRAARRRKLAVVGYGGIITLVVVAVAAPWLAPYGPHAQDISNVLAPPVWAGGEMAHPLGTDSVGRDVLSRLIYGARSSVLISVCAMLIGATLGVITGVASGFFGRIVDTVIMRLGDVQLALPFILIAIVILGMMTDRDPIHLIVVLGIPAWIVYARVVRSKVLAERDQDYVRAAETLGASSLRQMSRYVWPRVRGVVPPIALVDLSNLVVMESTLSFLGFGLTPPSISWGQILAEGRQNMVVSPWLPILPGIAIMLTVLSINLAAEGTRGGGSSEGTWRTVLRRKGAGTAAGGRVTPAEQEPVAEQGPDHVSDRHGSAAAEPTADNLLEVRDLSVEFPRGEDRAPVRAVRGVGFGVGRGRILGIVGESGSGKSVTAYAIMRLLSSPGRITSGSIAFDGTDLVRAPESALREVRGRRISMIFQNPAGSLNPVLTIGYQLTEAIRISRGADRATARTQAVAALREVGFGDPEHILRQYPFRLSGGQNQRVMIALTMVTEPQLLLADEPTTALDVTTQAQVLDQLRKVRDEHGTSIVIISHDMGLIGEIADDVVVMYAGQVCESGPAESVLTAPEHPYTQALLESMPHPERTAAGDLRSIPGDLPDPARVSAGCPFADRCPHVMDVCGTVDPNLAPVGPGRRSACHLHTHAKASATL